MARMDITGADYVRCPFFRKHNSTQICCEAAINGTESTVQNYETKKLKEYQQHMYCELDYKSCKHYNAVMQEKYPAEYENDRSSRRSFRKNLNLHKAIRDADIRYAELADALYVSESTLFRWLRHNIDRENEAKVLRVIEHLKEKRDANK